MEHKGIPPESLHFGSDEERDPDKNCTRPPGAERGPGQLMTRKQDPVLHPKH